MIDGGCETFPLLKPKGAANYQLVGSVLGEKSQGSSEIPLECSGLRLSKLSGYARPTTTNTVGETFIYIKYNKAKISSLYSKLGSENKAKVLLTSSLFVATVGEV